MTLEFGSARPIPKLEAVALFKDFPGTSGTVSALEDVAIRVWPGELVCLVGASGCGKSTLLNIAAGLEDATDGVVLVDGYPVTGPGADRGLVFQSYSLYPWRTVAGNVAFGLEVKGLKDDDIAERVRHYLGIMGLAKFAGALPKQISGGMQQRTAIARALATEPKVLLLDEPFGALDAQTRSAMQEFLLSVHRELGTTMLMVTHSVEEAVLLSQRIYVMAPNPGRVIAEFKVPFQDRSHSLVHEPEFLSFVRQVDDLLRQQASVVGTQ